MRTVKSGEAEKRQQYSKKWQNKQTKKRSKAEFMVREVNFSIF